MEEHEMSNALVPNTTALAPAPPGALPPVPWRDPHTVSPADLLAYIDELEKACLAQPKSADLRTCLGMAYAVNYDVYRSMDTLEAATIIDPKHFWAQLKYAELHYRLRALNRAEDETLKAVDLARSPWQLAVARKQLQEIRRLRRESLRNIEWNKPLTVPAVVFSLMMLVMFATMMWR